MLEYAARDDRPESLASAASFLEESGQHPAALALWRRVALRDDVEIALGARAKVHALALVRVVAEADPVTQATGGTWWRVMLASATTLARHLPLQSQRP